MDPTSLRSTPATSSSWNGSRQKSSKKPTVLEELERQKRPMAFSRIRHGNAWISKAQVLKKKGPWTLQKQHDPR
jgi:hypothetical protein